MMKRDDLIHPSVRGNKWRKLKYNIREIKRLGSPSVLTFGGAFSNHLHAVASAGREYGFETIGVVRGEETLPLNPVLAHAAKCGMRLCYMDRQTYRDKESDYVVNQLRDRFGDVYVLPEGGSNCLALKGAAEIAEEIDEAYDWIAVPCGTGGTLAGVVSAIPAKSQALGFSALKGGAFLKGDVDDLLARCGLEARAAWSVVTDYHFGGFAKVTPQLQGFADEFHERHSIELDLIYGAKMMYGLNDLLAQGKFQSGERVIAVHTGGLTASDTSPMSDTAA